MKQTLRVKKSEGDAKKPRVWVRGASLRGAGDELGLVAGDAKVIALNCPNYTDIRTCLSSGS
jgi:hypothetical protein